MGGSARPRILSLVWLLVAVTIVAKGDIAVAAEPIVVDDVLKSLVIGDKLDILEDPSGELTVQDVSSGSAASEFEPSESEKPNFGFTNSAFWARFELQNPSDDARHVLLELDNAILDEITLFQPTPGGSFESLTLGDHFPFDDRTIPNRNPVFEITVPPSNSQVYYVRFKTAGSMQMPLLLHDPVTFFKGDHNSQIAFGLYFGIVLVMGLYNLFLFFAVRDVTYIYYVLFIVGVSLFNMNTSGLSYEYLLKYVPFETLVHKSLLFFVALIGGGGCLFTMSFLRTKETAPRIHKFLLGFATLFGVLFIVTFFAPYGPLSNFYALVTVTWGFILTGVGVYMLAKGHRSARFYVLAWIALLTGCILQASRLLGLLPNSFLTMHGMEVGSALEVVLLSLALADRITIMKQEKELAQKAAIESFKKADRIKNEFLANTSHELRTPLNGIIGIAESLIDGAAGKLSKVAKENLSMIVSAGQRLSSLVNDLLDFSKLRNKNLELQLKPVALRQLVDVEFALLQPLIGSKDVALQNEVPQTLKSVYGDENRLIQILQNVIGNAIKFTESGSVTVHASQQGEFVEVRVVDTGIGIPADKMDDIFVAFEQGDGGTARKYGGTGIGLSVTKQLVELHGGTIKAESEVGKGTTMIFTLPATDEVAKNAESLAKLDYVARPVDINAQADAELSGEVLAPVDVEESGRSLNILAVDDEPLNLKVLTNQLSLHGHKVTVGRDGAEALKLIEKEGKPDLVLLDVMMPNMTGLDVCKVLREKYSPTELPIILLTAKNQLTDMLSGFSVGANDYLTKPFSSREVLARVRMHSQIADFAAALADANEELRVQIAKRSEQLFSTLALIGQGAREIGALEQGMVIGGRYAITAFVGEGGMGSVYEVKMLTNGERAALKVAKSGDPLALAQLAQEARMAVEVLHENIVRVMDVDVAKEGFLYVVMEFLDGRTLSELKGRWGDVDWGLKVLAQVCTGLNALHQHNLVHRDLKPGNIVISNGQNPRDFNVKIVDFGISSWETAQTLEKHSLQAKAAYSKDSIPAEPASASESVEPEAAPVMPPFLAEFADGEDTIAPTRAAGTHHSTYLSQEHAGTPRYMAPEQLKNGAPANQATDIWAVGVIAYQLLANKWPFSDEGFTDMLSGISTPTIDSIQKAVPSIDPKVSDILDGCLDSNPSKRPSAQKLVKVMAEVVK